MCAAWTADDLLPAEVLAQLWACRFVLAITEPSASRHRLNSKRVYMRR